MLRPGLWGNAIQDLVFFIMWKIIFSDKALCQGSVSCCRINLGLIMCLMMIWWHQHWGHHWSWPNQHLQKCSPYHAPCKKQELAYKPSATFPIITLSVQSTCCNDLQPISYVCMYSWFTCCFHLGMRYAALVATLSWRPLLARLLWTVWGCTRIPLVSACS